MSSSHQDDDADGGGGQLLLGLPDKAEGVLSAYLTTWDLMRLRLVNKTVKEWVERKGHFKKVAVHVQSYDQFQLLDEVVPWSNLVMECDKFTFRPDWIDHPFYSDLLGRLATSLTVLRLQDHRLPFSGLFTILGKCSVLEEVEVQTLSCCQWKAGLDSVEETASLSWLKKLQLSYLSWDTEEELDLFSHILSNCQSLVLLKVPHILMANLFHTHSDKEEDEIEKAYNALVHAKLIDPLVQRIASWPTKSDVVLRHLDVENLHHTEIFPKVVQACAKTNGVRLLNVSEAMETAMPDVEQRGYLSTIESLNGFTPFLKLEMLTNLKSIVLDSETSADSDAGPDSIEARLPKLKSISYCLPQDISPNLLKFLTHRRPSITSVSIEFQLEEEQGDQRRELHDFFNSEEFVTSFPRLENVTFIEWSGNDEDLVVLFHNLPSLRSLKLVKCTNLTEKAFLAGTDCSNPPILKLQNLKHLWLDCQLSDLVLKDTIRHMKLESFYYSSESITLAGFLALTRGPITTSLISFPVIPPSKCTRSILDNFISYFKILEKKPISSSIPVGE